MLFKKYRFNRICRNISQVRIQGATNVAKAALKAYSIFPTKQAKLKLLRLRPTEPMLSYVLSLADKMQKKKILEHFNEAQNKINREVFMLIKGNPVIFTHCHSTNVVRALIYAKKHGRHFEIYNTETRPLFQGRKTASELSRAGIKVTNFIDAAASVALAPPKFQHLRAASMVFLGADALLKGVVINKTGSRMIAQLAHDYKIPVYIIADSWKYAARGARIEQRNFKEVWNPRQNRIHVKNPAFEAVPKKLITKIITERGTQDYEDFIRSIKKRSMP